MASSGKTQQAGSSVCQVIVIGVVSPTWSRLPEIAVLCSIGSTETMVWGG